MSRSVHVICCDVCLCFMPLMCQADSNTLSDKLRKRPSSIVIVQTLPCNAALEVLIRVLVPAVLSQHDTWPTFIYTTFFFLHCMQVPS